MSGWLKNCRLCHVLPYIKPDTIQDVEKFWKDWVEGKGYTTSCITPYILRGLNDELYKVKPISEVDSGILRPQAVIIGINKRKLFWSKQVTSIKLALMDEVGNFVEIGDCASGINQKLRTSLWKLMEFKVGEDEKVVWVKPIVICNIQYTDLFKGRNKVFSYEEGKGYTHISYRELVRLRHPRLVAFRTDKRVTPEDLRIEQLPLDFWRDVWELSKSLGK